MRRGFADSTIHQYNSILRKFSYFAKEHLRDWNFPIPATVFASYGLWLSDQGFAPGTINSHLAGLGWWHKIKGFPDPSKEYLILRFKIGLAKSGPPSKQAAPVRFPLLKEIIGALPFFLSDFDVKLYRAAFLLAYFASLRVSEYAVAGNSSHTLNYDNVTFRGEEGGGLELTLESYKASARPARLLIPQEASRDFCPVEAIRCYKKARPPGKGPFFVRGCGTPLSAFLVNKTLRSSLCVLGLSTDNFSAHSFRAGRTTDLVEMDQSDAVIRQSGRWKSNAFLKYVRFDMFSLPKGAPTLKD